MEEQIFDIRQRRWPICYRLEGENTEDIQKTEEFLSGQLQNAIRMVMNSAHEAVEEAISRLTPEAILFIQRHIAFVYFWIKDEDVARLGAQWMANATACLLDLKLIRVYFEPKASRFVYTWTYIGKLAIKKMEPSFPPIPPDAVPVDLPPGSFPTSDESSHPGGGSLLTWLNGLWAKRPR